jgi:glycosyltransferase involved in cell wall biosynthesis
MQLCHEVTEGLAEHGHAVAVLTSRLDKPAAGTLDYPVFYDLQLEPDWESHRSVAQQFFLGRRGREQAAVARLRALNQEFRPDVIFIWHAIGIPRAVLAEAERLKPDATAYYFADYQPEIGDEYLNYWTRSTRRAPSLLKRLLALVARALLRREGKPVLLKYSHSACVSAYVRDRLAKSHIPARSVVIRNGIDLALFSVNDRLRLPQVGELRLLYAGRMIANKGVHTLVEALIELQGRQRPIDLKLTLLGDGETRYLEQLHKRVEAAGLQEQILFREAVPRQQMPQVLRAHDVLLLTSEYAEPLARSIQEAMAMGLLVIGTTTGGSGELLVDGETGLAFRAGDSGHLADQFERLLGDRATAAAIAERSRKRVQSDFNIERTIAETEAFLLAIVQGAE